MRSAVERRMSKRYSKDIKKLLPLTKRTSIIGGYKIPIANFSYPMAMEAAWVMAEGQPFAATYYDGRTQRHWSLRSRFLGIDVAKVAAKYGGTGDASAAVFSTEIGWDGDPDWCTTGVV